MNIRLDEPLERRRRRWMSSRSGSICRSWRRRQPRGRPEGLLPRRGVYDHFIPTRGRSPGDEGRVPHRLHALPGRGVAGIAAGVLRIPDDGLPADRAWKSPTPRSTKARRRWPKRRMMALNVTGKREMLVSQGVHPHYRQVLKTYLSDLPADVQRNPAEERRDRYAGAGKRAGARHRRRHRAVAQFPGAHRARRNDHQVRPRQRIAEHPVVQPAEPGLLKQPGEMGVDIATGEGQPLGIPLQFGGPYLGLFAAQDRNSCARCPAAWSGRRWMSRASARSA